MRFAPVSVGADQKTHEIIAAAFAGTTWYAAVRVDEPSGKSYTLALIVLTQAKRDGEFLYKPVDETMGPCECACPKRIMRLLSPIEEIPNPSYAQNWRDRVARHYAKIADRTRQIRPIGLGTR